MRSSTAHLGSRMGISPSAGGKRPREKVASPGFVSIGRKASVVGTAAPTAALPCVTEEPLAATALPEVAR